MVAEYNGAVYRNGMQLKIFIMVVCTFNYTKPLLLYFAWADQRVQQFYNYHNVSMR